MMKFKKLTGVTAIFLGGSLAFTSMIRADDHEEGESSQGGKSISDVMKAGFKGKESMVKRIIAGDEKDDEIKQLIELCLTLEKHEAPEGEAASWKEKTDALTKAAIYVYAERDGAREMLKTASNCKACHSDHKPD